MYIQGYTMTMKTLDQAIADAATIYEDGAAQGWLTPTAQLRIAEVHRSLIVAKAGAAKTTAKAKKLMPVVERLKKDLKAHAAKQSAE